MGYDNPTLDATLQGPQVPAYCEPDDVRERFLARHRDTVLKACAMLYEIAASYEEQDSAARCLSAPYGSEWCLSTPCDWMEEFRITLTEVRAAAGR